ncbi:MAG: MarC family protein [Bacteroidales bacterium]|nr:MarC family protein [Bacteroidales bacterium]
MLDFNIVDIFSAFMVLFAVIDITGSIPIIIDLRNKHGQIEANKATLVATITLFAFLLGGESILNIFGVDIPSFAIAGSFILLFLALEMILGIELFKSDEDAKSGASIVPLAFPLIAGAGSITSLLSLKAEYSTLNISIALILNMIIVFVVLKNTVRVEKLIGQTGIMILRKVFGIILLAIAIKLFVANTGISLTHHA